jgi:hypothetical protein
MQEIHSCYPKSDLNLFLCNCKSSLLLREMFSGSLKKQKIDVQWVSLCHQLNLSTHTQSMQIFCMLGA